MSGTRIRSSMNLRPLLRELDRLADMPTPRAAAELDSVLGGAFAATQEFVHIKTGRLKASGDVRSFVFESRYEGVIRYGGAAAFYAPFEFSRDGHHPFDDDPAFHAQEDKFVDAVDDVIGDV